MQRSTAPLDAVVRRALWRQLPLLFAIQAVAYANVAAVALVQPELQRDVGLTPAAYGLGASALVLGFLLFSIPSNLLMARVGARWTLGRATACLGLGTGALTLVSSPTEYVIVRFATGVFAAGIPAGVLLYITDWYPESRRARVVALLLLAPAAAGAALGTLTGAVLSALDGAGGLHAWQWLFVLLGTASIGVAALIGLRLDERPDRTDWLTAEQRVELGRALQDAHVAAPPSGMPARRILASTAFARLAVTATALGFGAGTMTHAAPLALRGLTDAGALAGLLSAIPYLAGGAAALIWGHLSDRAPQERRRHLIIACIIGAAGCALLGTAPGLAIGVFAATLVYVGVFSSYVVCWPVLVGHLTPTALALGIAVLQAAEKAGMLAAPAVHGLALEASGSLRPSLVASAALLVLASLVLPARRSSAMPAGSRPDACDDGTRTHSG